MVAMQEALVPPVQLRALPCPVHSVLLRALPCPAMWHGLMTQELMVALQEAGAPSVGLVTETPQ